VIERAKKQAIEPLLAIMRALRDPASGCPWDLEQSFANIAPYTLEEAYEVADAIARGATDDLKDELGDLLFQVVFHAEIARSEGLFDFSDVARAICDKMIRRHPHVFGNATRSDSAAQTLAWEEDKRRERAQGEQASVLDGIAAALPALVRAVKLTRRASSVGFDWNDAERVWEKLDEETGELKQAIRDGGADAIEDEFGDMLFVMANLARHLSVDPEHALRRTNAKFTRRFKAVEAAVAASARSMDDVSLDEMEAIWTGIKAQERREKQLKV
jgi:MazG family protein